MSSQTNIICGGGYPSDLISQVLATPGAPLDGRTRHALEPLFGHEFSRVRIYADADAAKCAATLNARAFTVGESVVFASGAYAPDTKAGLRLLAHELTHVAQNRQQSDGERSINARDLFAAEREAERASARVAEGLPAGRIRETCAPIALTPASNAIERLISYTWTDWTVTMSEEVAVLGVLRTDPDMPATIRDLNASRMLYALVDRVDEGDNPRKLIELLGGGSDAGTKTLVRPAISVYRIHLTWYFDLSHELQNGFRRLGARFSATPFNMAPYAALIPSAPDAPFSGVGASGVNPATLSIPLSDQALMAAGHEATRARYSNPIPGSLPAYLATLSPAQRRQQAELLVQQPIVSIVPHSYGARLPSRADVMRLAAAQHNLHPALLAAFILAEQRDQSRNEDAKDLIAATSVVMQANTSIGLGQVVVSTARGEDLFADLLSASFRSSLNHTYIAMLLASDEFNIFAVAKYIRRVANRAAGRPIASLPNTKRAFPGINMAAYAANSRTWPDDNIRALGSEYTSAPWDDRLSVGWGNFVYEAYRDVLASGIF
jgi:hypothetical protein